MGETIAHIAPPWICVFRSPGLKFESGNLPIYYNNLHNSPRIAIYINHCSTILTPTRQMAEILCAINHLLACYCKSIVCLIILKKNCSSRVNK